MAPFTNVPSIWFFKSLKDGLGVDAEGTGLGWRGYWIWGVRLDCKMGDEVLEGYAVQLQLVFEHYTDNEVCGASPQAQEGVSGFVCGSVSVSFSPTVVL